MKTIQNLSNVKIFIQELIVKEKVLFHPDERFEDYVNIHNDTPTFSKAKAEQYNTLLHQCFEICEKENKDIYELGMSISQKAR